MNMIRFSRKEEREHIEKNMSLLFYDVKRPRAEINVIHTFILLYAKTNIIYKQKDYQVSLENYKKCYEMLIPIYDELPKIIVLYKIMKCQFNLTQYEECIQTKITLRNFLEDKEIISDKNIKIYSTIYLYELFINLLSNSYNEAIQNCREAIEFINHKNYDLNDRNIFFWKYLNGLLKIGKQTDTQNFKMFKESYESMIVKVEKDDTSVLKVKKDMKETFKSFMSTKIRKFIFEELNKYFYKIKYNLTTENKVVKFLEDKMHICVRDNNTDKLIEMFKMFIKLNKINLKDNFGKMKMKDLINEQRNRIITFDTIFGNIIRGFDIIFSSYYTENYNESLELNMEQNIDDEDNSNEILRKNQPKMGMFASQKSNLAATASNVFKDILNHINKPIIYDTDINSKFKIKRKLYKCPEFDFEKDVYMPPNLTDAPKCQTGKNKNDNNEYYDQAQKELLLLKNAIDEPQKGLNDKNQKLTSVSQPTFETQPSSISIKANKSSQVPIYKKPEYTFRNVNFFLMNILINQFSKNIYLRRADYIEIKIPSFIKSKSSQTEAGNQVNQDLAFSYDDFLLIKNFSIIGVFDGHGKYGKDVVEALKKLFPAYMYYLTFENNLIRREEDINRVVATLFKDQDLPSVKELNIISYFFKKFDMIYKYMPFINRNISEIKTLIAESFQRTSDDLKDRFKIDTELSGSTACTLFFYGKKLYVANIGDSKALMFSYIFDENRWAFAPLSREHKPEILEEKIRINYIGGRVDKRKDDNGESFGPFRVFPKNVEVNNPSLNMSRSLGDEYFKKLGVICEPDLFEYRLVKENKFVVIGTDGFWDSVTPDEIIKVVGDAYEIKEKAEVASRSLMDKIKSKIEDYKKVLEENKKKKKELEKLNKENSEGGENKTPSKEVSNKNKEVDEKYKDDITFWIVFLEVKDE